MEQRLFNTGVKYGFPANFVRLLIAQAKHESANFTSAVFKKNNNLFGYKFIGQKLATKGSPAPKSEGDFYAKYATPEDSLLELLLYVKRRIREGKLSFAELSAITPEEWAQKLKSFGYYGAPLSQYSNALVKWLKTVKVTQVTASIGGLLFLATCFF